MSTVKKCQNCQQEYFSDEKYCENCGTPLISLKPPPTGVENPVAGRYKVLAKAGQGGMGSVYLAHDTLLSRDVAVKILHQNLAKRKNAPRRLLREARAAGRISHPNVVQIYDAGRLQSDGRPYLVMEFLQGTTLKEVFEERKGLPWQELYLLGRQILSGLFAAHKKSVIHRDLKPGNIFLEEDAGETRVKLVDFGLSKILHGRGGSHGMTRLTEDGAILGTPLYMAPEQVRGEVATSLSDLFALGVIFYRGLTGSFPFIGANAVELYKNILQSVPMPPRVRAPERYIPAEVEALVLSALAAEPASRPQSAQEFLSRLDTCANAENPSTYPLQAPLSVESSGISDVVYEQDDSIDSLEITSSAESAKTLQEIQSPFFPQPVRPAMVQPENPVLANQHNAPIAKESIPSVIVSPEMMPVVTAPAKEVIPSTNKLPLVENPNEQKKPKEKSRRVRELPLVVPAKPRRVTSPTQLPTAVFPKISSEATPAPTVSVRRVQEMAAVPEEEKKE